MKLVQIEQSTPEWHAFRKSKIGSSDSPIILGESKWCSPLTLWERKLGLTPEQEETEAMTRGKLLEPQARAEFEALTGYKVKPIVGVHDEYPWMAASFDGMTGDLKIAVEIKCAGKADHETARHKRVPSHYMPQLQHQLCVSGMEFMYYLSYRDESASILLEVERDQEMIDRILEAEIKFMKCLHTFTPPEMGDKDFQVRDDLEIHNKVIRFNMTARDLDDAQEAHDLARKELLESCDGKSTKAFGMKISKVIRKGNIDYSQIEALKGIDLEQYRKPATESWRITMENGQ